MGDPEEGLEYANDEANPEATSFDKERKQLALTDKNPRNVFSL